jgi:hypothetical protein
VPGEARIKKKTPQAASPSDPEELPSSSPSPEIDSPKGPVGETVIEIEDLIIKEE